MRSDREMGTDRTASEPYSRSAMLSGQRNRVEEVIGAQPAPGQEYEQLRRQWTQQRPLP
jgi:hypothetical protein